MIGQADEVLAPRTLMNQHDGARDTVMHMHCVTGKKCAASVTFEWPQHLQPSWALREHSMHTCKS